MKKIQTLLVFLIVYGLFITHSLAAISDHLTTIELETPVHFLAPDGSDLRVEVGTYTIEPAEEWIRLMSGERHDAVLIEAMNGTHKLELEHSMGLSVPGETEEESDLHHVTLLLPGGQSLDATGTYSGIRHRGFLKNTFHNVKKKAKQAYKKAKSSAGKKSRKIVKKFQKALKPDRKKLQNAALKTKRYVEKTARKAASNIRSRIQKAQRTVTGGAGQWTRLSRAASAAAVQEVREWLRKAYIDAKRCKITGPSAIGTPGVLLSRYRFQKKIQMALEKAGASKDIAIAWDKAFNESWKQWSQRTTIPGLPFYPAFAMWPGPKAPPTPNIPVPLGSLVSSGSGAMTPPVLAQKVLSRLGKVAKHQKVKNAVNGFATDLSKRFATCMAGCMVSNVMGSGPVPGFAPPLGPPANPVINGTCVGGGIPKPVGF
ncbi:MAG: hypothetical protein ACPGYT_06855 [Nitrospirales bacterium]